MGNETFLEGDVRASWRWLAHDAYTELASLHPEYRAGREHYEHNKAHGAFPRTLYARSVDDVVTFVRNNVGKRMVCVGFNDRPRIFKNERGFPRAAREEEIEKAKGLFIDIDIETKTITPTHTEALERWLDGGAADYFQDLGLRKPERAFTGRGYHLHFAYPTILVADCPDLSARHRKLAEDFREDHHKEFARLEARMDSTFDLRRMVKVYGTAKPNVGILSRFHGGERVEDPELRTYLLGMTMPEAAPAIGVCDPAYGPKFVSIRSELPPLFLALVKTDPYLAQLWEGNGKQNGDTSRSGYDFNLTRRLLSLGYRNLDDLATIVALRPEGAVQKSGKGFDYICRTIGKAVGS